MDRSIPITAYQTLGVSPQDDFDTIRRAWRALARAYHPDVVGGCPDAASRRFAEINDAYDKLRFHRKTGTDDADRASPEARSYAKQAQAKERAKAKARQRAAAAEAAAKRRARAEEARRAQARMRAEAEMLARAKAEEQATARRAAEQRAEQEKAAQEQARRDRNTQAETAEFARSGFGRLVSAPREAARQGYLSLRGLTGSSAAPEVNVSR